MKKSEESLNKNKELLIIPDGIAVINKDQKIIVFNDAASRISGFSENDAIGENLEILFSNCKEELSYLKKSFNENRSFSNLGICITDKKGNRKIKQFSSSAYDILMDYDWPGNIRELENVIEHSFVLCRSDVIQEDDMPKYLRNKKK